MIFFLPFILAWESIEIYSYEDGERVIWKYLIFEPEDYPLYVCPLSKEYDKEGLSPQERSIFWSEPLKHGMMLMTTILNEILLKTMEKDIPIGHF